MKVVVQILMFSVMEGSFAMDCRDDGTTSLASCQNNPYIRIEKIRKGHKNTIKSYQLSLNYKNTLWSASNEKWIECGNLCHVCASLPGQNQSSCHNMCEEKVDTFLNVLCEVARPTESPPNTITTTVTVKSTEVVTTTVTVAPTHTPEPRINISSQICPATVTITVYTSWTKASKQVAVSNSIPVFNSGSEMIINSNTHCQSGSTVIAFGTLAGLFLIVSVTVIIGWVWTCWTIAKKRGGMDISSKNTAAAVITNTNKDERYFENPTYEDTSSRLNLTSGPVSDEAHKNGNSSAAVYSTISQNGEDGSTYDVLTRAQPTDHRQGQVVPGIGSENYSQLGLRGNDVENNYQLLDKEEMGSKVKN